MRHDFRFYRQDDFSRVEALVLASYEWCVPVWGLARHEFCAGLHPAFKDAPGAWELTTGLWEQDGEIVAAVISEGCFEGDAFFLFDRQDRMQDDTLLERMFHHAQTYLCAFDEKERQFFLNLCIQQGAEPVLKMARAKGFRSLDSQRKDRCLILPFKDTPFSIQLPEGFRFADGKGTSARDLANAHRFSFGYGQPYASRGPKAFHELRQMPAYDPDLDLMVLDQEGKPAGMAIVWHDAKLPYCELEPLGVVFWQRRRGIAKALIHEAANRVMAKHACRGMLGGDQAFYWDLGFKVESDNGYWQWHPAQA